MLIDFTNSDQLLVSIFFFFFFQFFNLHEISKYKWDTQVMENDQ